MTLDHPVWNHLNQVNANVQGALAWTAAMMGAGSLLRCGRILVRPTKKTKQRLQSLATWWAVFLLVAIAAIAGPKTIVLLTGALSMWGLWEFRRMAATLYGTTLSWYWAFLVSAIYYLALLSGGPWAWYPALATAGTGCVCAIAGINRGYVRDVANPVLGMLIVVFCLSHATLLFVDGRFNNQVGGPVGWFVLLVLLTELNDIAQAHWGRLFGSRKITPTISPNKTWEGFLLGVTTTTLVALALGPQLSPAGPIESAVIGLLIGVSGFLGDICMSGIKRDCSVKDSGRSLPGQGGILDRIDSLTLSAPVLYYSVLSHQALLVR